MEKTNNQPIHYVLFDLGNTLIYFDGNWRDILQTANLKMVRSLQLSGYKFDFADFATEFIDRLQRYYFERDVDYKEVPTSRILKSLLAKNSYENVPQDDIKNALETFYKETESYWKVEDDTFHLLDTLMNNKVGMGIISNAGDKDNVDRLIDNAKIRHYFDLIYISAEFGIRKPHVEMFESALKKWGTDVSHCIMVGDTLSADIMGANKIGMRSIWVNRHVLNAENQIFDQSNKPTYIVETLADIINIIYEINQ